MISQRATISSLRRSLLAIVVIAAAGASPSARGQNLTPAAQEAKPCRESQRTLTSDAQVSFFAQGVEIQPCETHSHLVSLDAGRYVRFALNLHGLDASLAAFAPDGALLHSVTEPNIIEGKKSLWFITKVAGTYRLEVRRAGEGTSGSYDVHLQRTCAATDENSNFIRIDQGITEGLELQQRGTEHALRQAVPLLTEIASLAGKNNHWPKEEIITGTEDWYRATPLMYLGEIYLSLGEYENALGAFNRALEVDGWGDRGWSLKDIGDVYSALGDKQLALDYYRRSLPAFEKTYSNGGSKRGPAIAEAAIGSLYASLGDYQLALTHLDQSLQFWRGDNEIRGEAQTLMQVSNVYVRLERYGDALGHYDQALRVYRSTSDHLREGRALCAMARVRITLRDYGAALANLDDAQVAARQAGDRLGQADVLAEVGRIHNLTANNEKALEYLRESLDIYRSLKAAQGEAGALFLIARVERDTGRLLEARSDIESAIQRIEVTRIGLSDEQLRASYMATVRDYYDLYVDLLMRMHQANPGAGFESDALGVSEQARARSLMDSLGAALHGVSAADPALVERKRRLWGRIRGRVQDRERNGTRDQVAWRDEIDGLIKEYEAVEERVRAANAGYASLTHPRTLNASEIQRQLDGNTLLLEYSLGDEQSYLWAVSRGSITSHPLPKRSEIESSARRVYDLLTARNSHPKGETSTEFTSRVERADSDYPAAALELGRMILGPAAAELGTKRLVIVAEGALQFIPFSALPASSNGDESYRALILDHEIVTLPSASVLTLLREEQWRRSPAKGTVAVLADPVFTADDPRLGRYRRLPPAASRGPGTAVRLKSDIERAFEDLNEPLTSANLPRLLSTRWEAEQIASRRPEASLKVLDFNASREMAMSGALRAYRVVHFASHAIIDEVHPELSGLVLSMVDKRGEARDGYLRVEDIYNMKLAADLVVLSACRTGLGKDVRGEGLVGLTRGFMYAGAQRIVMSLWKVNDQATADLMAKFYRQMFPVQGKGSRAIAAAAALRLARLEMMKSPRWRAPYFWAGFTLHGEWR